MVRISRVVPKEWAKYGPVGNVIPKTRFVVFKTPLNQGLLRRIPKEKHFSTAHLFRSLAERGQSLGLVVDLTDTDRYYDRKDIEGMCIHYEKIFCPGRGFVDREESVEQFNSAIERFISNNPDPELLIGVHCTHGVNRSGYLICRFLIERLGWSSHEAIEAFEQARGYPIEKGAYVQALHRAAKESRGKRLRQSDSDDDSEVKRKKHKKNKKKHRDEFSGNAEQMGEMINQFLGVLGQHAQAHNLDTGGPSSSNYESPADAFESPAQSSWPTMNVAGGSVAPVVDESQQSNSPYEEGEGGEYEEGEEEGEEGEPIMTQSRARRERKKKKVELLRVMRRGNFHEIQEMIQNQFGNK